MLWITNNKSSAACNAPVSCRAKSAGTLSARRITRQYRRAYIKRLKEREYRRLRDVVPSLARREKVTKVAVIEEAIKYIDELHQALTERVQSENDYPAINHHAVATVAQQLFTQSKAHCTSRSRSTAPVLGERNSSQSTSAQLNNVLNGSHQNRNDDKS